MSEVSHRSAGHRGDGAAIARAAADWLSLAAAPAFAMMALMTVCLGGRMDPLCSAAGASPFSGMVPMYLLMSAFHIGALAEADLGPAKLTTSGALAPSR